MRRDGAAGLNVNSQGSALRPRKPAVWPGQTLPSVLKMRLGKVTEGRNTPPPAELVDDAAQAGVVVGRAGIGVLEVLRLMRMAGQHVVAAGRVGVVVAGHRPQDADLVGHLGGARHQFADLQARHAGGDGFEFPADSGGAFGLGSHVECWGGPPMRNRTMQDFARAGVASWAAGALAARACRCRRSCGIDNPNAPKLPSRSTSRRVNPSHSLAPPRYRFNMPRPPCRGRCSSGGPFPRIGFGNHKPILPHSRTAATGQFQERYAKSLKQGRAVLEDWDCAAGGIRRGCASLYLGDF